MNQNPLLLMAGVLGGDGSVGLKLPSEGILKAVKYSSNCSAIPNTPMEFDDDFEDSTTFGTFIDSKAKSELDEQLKDDEEYLAKAATAAVRASISTGTYSSLVNSADSGSGTAPGLGTSIYKDMQPLESSSHPFGDTESDNQNAPDGSQRFQLNAHGFFSRGERCAIRNDDLTSDKDVFGFSKKKVYDPKADNHKYRRFLFQENLPHSKEAIAEFERRSSGLPTLQVRLPITPQKLIGSEREIYLKERSEEQREHEKKKMERRVRFNIAMAAAEKREVNEDQETEIEDPRAEGEQPSSKFKELNGDGNAVENLAVQMLWPPTDRDKRSAEDAVSVSNPDLEDPSNIITWPSLSDAIVSASSPKLKTRALATINLSKEETNSSSKEERFRGRARKLETNIPIKVSSRLSKPSLPKVDQKQVQKTVVEDNNGYRVPKAKSSILAQKKREETLRMKAMKSAAQQSDGFILQQSAGFAPESEDEQTSFHTSLCFEKEETEDEFSE